MRSRRAGGLSCGRLVVKRLMIYFVIIQIILRPVAKFVMVSSEKKSLPSLSHELHVKNKATIVQGDVFSKTPCMTIKRSTKSSIRVT
jgi:hypothetical protein